ncbi:MAG TPA: hypothetical protein VLR10_04500, partial [Nitrososphaeraceae archaeon]|nr:hypothetical protein [Nitrososphaeraceae archaeon]
ISSIFIGFNEVIGETDPSIVFFIKNDNIAKLRVSQNKIDRAQVELICINNRFDFLKFNEWYKKAKKHKV